VAQRVDRRVWLLAAVFAAFLGYELAPRDERKILGLLDGLCEKLTRTRDSATLAELQNAAAAAAAPSLLVRVTELAEGPRGLDDLMAWSRELLTAPPLSFSLVDSEVHIEGAVARVRANLLVSERGSSEQHRDLRPTELSLHKSAGAWKIESIVVQPTQPEKPEARP
jgi:hypothetical protein